MRRARFFAVAGAWLAAATLAGCATSGVTTAGPPQAQVSGGGAGTAAPAAGAAPVAGKTYEFDCAQKYVSIACCKALTEECIACAREQRARWLAWTKQCREAFEKETPPGVKPHYVACDPDRPDLPCTPDPGIRRMRPGVKPRYVKCDPNQPNMPCTPDRYDQLPPSLSPRAP